MSMSDQEFLAAVRSGAASGRLIGGWEPRSRVELSGEHRLMFAILADALVLYVNGLSSERTVVRRAARGARVWLESRDRASPFAFECICDRLGLDSGYLRRGLQTVRLRPVTAWLTARHGRR
jgi:hypothetical protein